VSKCVNTLCAMVRLLGVPLSGANEYIRKHTADQVTVDPGFAFRGIRLLGDGPMVIGVKYKKGRILFPFTKPCYGTVVYEVDAGRDEIEALIQREGS